MRVLRFKVDGQIVEKDKECDFTNLVPGTKGYLQAEFEFSEHWDNCIKVVEFSSGQKEYPPQILDENNNCIIPAEALARSVFKIKVLGSKDRIQLTTNSIIIHQDGGAR